MGQDRRSHQADGLPRIAARGPALQADHDGEQHRANGSNTGRGNTGSSAMNRHNSTDKDKEHAAPRLRGAFETDQKARREAENGLTCWSSSEGGGSSLRNLTA